MKIKLILLAAILLGVGAFPAMAEVPYVALDFGQSRVKDVCADNPPGVTGCKDSARMFRLGVGSEITPAWSAEFSYGNYGKASAGTMIDPFFGTITADWEISGIQISGIGKLPLSNNFFLTGKIGFARTDITVSGSVLGINVSTSVSSTNLAYGVGMQYDFSGKISARAQYEDLGNVGDSNITPSKVTLLSAGLSFRF